ncbi:MAG: tyrosine--tRNA ligase [Candidatus Fermentibacteraceae bacterium]|nr:tyrosine--tRNA ligase [Candidatus Fermentibacteraceae bacterium]
MGLLRKLSQRGLIYQMTAEEKLSELLDGPSLSFYIGFDPTAGSLHLGHLVPIMIARHLQMGGHRPILLVGGATALVGDPSERSLERTFESKETISNWAESIRGQLGHFLEFTNEDDGAVLLDNYEWLSKLNHIDFLREVGRHFSVNRMLSAESVKLRLESGISFLEFGYSLLQAYDFLHLYRNFECVLQVGGSDQWGNIVSGIDLIRRTEQKEVWGFTCPLVTTASGEKMSKTQAGGAIWLDPELTSPYEYYQFWINVSDEDAIYFLRLYTFVPGDEIDKLALLTGADIRKVKEKLSFEATVLAHGREEALKAEKASRSLFTGQGNQEDVPTLDISKTRLNDGISCLDLFVETGLCPSRSEVRRMAKQGGLYIDNKRVVDPLENLDPQSISTSILLRAGKKRYCRVNFS